MSKKNLLTLSDKISQILNSAPSVPDPEDDAHEATNAKVVSNDELDYEFSSTAQPKLRKNNLQLLDVTDKRYSGTKITRKQLESEEESYSEESDLTDEDSEVNDEEINDAEKEGEYSEGSSDDSGEDLQVINFKESNIDIQVQKGNSVKKQLLIWENLLETRIKLQKTLILANRLPKSVCEKVKSKRELEVAQQGLKNLLDKLLDLQEILLKAYPETKKLQTGEVVESDNEEISSDTEEDEPPSKQAKTDYESVLSLRHEMYKPYRNNVIRKWNDKTRISVAKNLGNSNSVINQIEFILKDREKYLKRTQLKRSNYTIIGEKITEQNHSGDIYNSEIFDDDDFYHQLLRELIEFKSSEVTDPVKLSRQWIQLQSMRSKMKRNIDTKATKGRRIRYTVHQKLVNYLAPIPNNKWTDSAKSELFNSLFGSRIKPK